MRFNAAAFNAHLGGPVGQQLAWRRARACPCLDPSSRQPLFTCVPCGGKGVLWAKEVCGTAGLSGQSQRASQATHGTWEPGDAVLTIPATAKFYDAGRYDRFRAIDAKRPFSRVLIRGECDRIFGTIASVSRVFWYADDGTTEVDGALPGFDIDGRLTFADPNRAPPVGRAYTIEGAVFSEWFAFLDLPTPRNVGAHLLPKKLPVRTFDVFGRS